MDGDRREREMKIRTAQLLIKEGWETLNDGKGPGIERKSQVEEIPETIWDEMRLLENNCILS